jgi:sarcosine oxidase, subunit alpha
VIEGNNITGRVTSIAASPALGHAIGMAYVSPEKTKPGSTFNIRIEGGQMITATVVETPFYDPKGERQKVS